MVTSHLEENKTSDSCAPLAVGPAQDLDTPIHHEGRWFRDRHGRTLLMRGVNVCGSSKLPTYPYPGSTHLYDEKLFWDHRGVSFVGRPFPLSEARTHFARLQAWGLTLIRLLVTWESIEHAGPGEYDENYIDYLRELIKMMPEFGLKCLIDPHQDTWSRFSGGSGAPGWTFEVAGMNIRNFKETGAAYVHNTNAVPGDPLPMVWPTNYTKLACCTMFTLFFAGDTFAPQLTYNGQSVQQVLTTSFVNAFVHLATRLSDLDPVIGFEVLNEPHPGYIGLEHLDAFDPIVNLIFGDAPSPLQCFALGDGIPQKVGVYIKSWPFPTKRSHTRVINESKTSAWLPGYQCVWRQHGVWDTDKEGQPRLLDTHYFSKHPKTGAKIEFYRDFYVPFVNRYAKAIQAVKKDWYCFAEPLANEKCPEFGPDDHHVNMVYAPHWYDLNCVFYKKFDGRITHDVQSLQNGGNVISATYFGRNGAKANYRGQIRNIKQSGLDNMGEHPCLFGEVGIPMDLNQRVAFETGDYSKHVMFMDAVIHALETNLTCFTLWNYDVCNDHEYGDHWNGENFSIFSPFAEKGLGKDEDEDLSSISSSSSSKSNVADGELSLKTFDALHVGGRVLHAAIRPYAVKVAGIPEHAEFHLDTLEYTFSFKPYTNAELDQQRQKGWDVESATARTTEIYIPHFHFSSNASLSVLASHGQWDYRPDIQTLLHTYESSAAIEKITIRVGVKDQSRSAGRCIIT
ncbi:glycoside hydrolase superfamily [Dichotomocladium elegans]|nr:glycoside hydrolase superfamily [Dichotomocladium elegans]